MNKIIIDLQIACNDIIGIPQKKHFEYWIQAMQPIFSATTEITIRIVDEKESNLLNLVYGGKDSPTNILSFPFEGPHEIIKTLLGDLVICRQVIEREAKEQKKSIDAHWAHIVIHGMLHLLGTHHRDNAESEQMKALEIMVMQKLGYPSPY